MAALEDAKAHLRKAREFLDSAQLNLDVDLYSAATSAAVTSGINSKDAICLKLAGRTNKAEDHKQAVAELRKAGAAAAKLAPALARLIAVKKKAQYQADGMIRTDAIKAVERATTLYEGAVEIVSS